MIRAPPACWYSASASMSGISSMAPLRMQRAAALGAEGAGLDGEGADRAIIRVAAMCVVIQHCPRDRVPIFTDKTSNLRAIAIRQFDDGLMVFLCYHLSSTAARQPAPRLPCP